MARVLITGASRGLGRSLALVLSQRGHEVIASALHITDLADLEATSKMRNPYWNPDPPEAVFARSLHTPGRAV